MKGMHVVGIGFFLGFISLCLPLPGGNAVPGAATSSSATPLQVLSSLLQLLRSFLQLLPPQCWTPLR